MIFVKLVFLRVIMLKNMMGLIQLKNIVNKYEEVKERKDIYESGAFFLIGYTI